MNFCERGGDLRQRRGGAEDEWSTRGTNFQWLDSTRGGWGVSDGRPVDVRGGWVPDERPVDGRQRSPSPDWGRSRSHRMRRSESEDQPWPWWSRHASPSMVWVHDRSSRPHVAPSGVALDQNSPPRPHHYSLHQRGGYGDRHHTRRGRAETIEYAPQRVAARRDAPHDAPSYENCSNRRPAGPSRSSQTPPNCQMYSSNGGRGSVRYGGEEQKSAFRNYDPRSGHPAGPAASYTPKSVGRKSNMAEKCRPPNSQVRRAEGEDVSYPGGPSPASGGRRPPPNRVYSPSRGTSPLPDRRLTPKGSPPDCQIRNATSGRSSGVGRGTRNTTNNNYDDTNDNSQKEVSIQQHNYSTSLSSSRQSHSTSTSSSSSVASSSHGRGAAQPQSSSSHSGRESAATPFGQQLVKIPSTRASPASKATPVKASSVPAGKAQLQPSTKKFTPGLNAPPSDVPNSAADHVEKTVSATSPTEEAKAKIVSAGPTGAAAKIPVLSQSSTSFDVVTKRRSVITVEGSSHCDTVSPTRDVPPPSTEAARLECRTAASSTVRCSSLEEDQQSQRKVFCSPRTSPLKSPDAMDGLGDPMEIDNESVEPEGARTPSTPVPPSEPPPPAPDFPPPPPPKSHALSPRDSHGKSPFNRKGASKPKASVGVLPPGRPTETSTAASPIEAIAAVTNPPNTGTAELPATINQEAQQNDVGYLDESRRRTPCQSESAEALQSQNLGGRTAESQRGERLLAASDESLISKEVDIAQQQPALPAASHPDSSTNDTDDRQAVISRDDNNKKCTPPDSSDAKRTTTAADLEKECRRNRQTTTNSPKDWTPRSRVKAKAKAFSNKTFGNVAAAAKRVAAKSGRRGSFPHSGRPYGPLPLREIQKCPLSSRAMKRERRRLRKAQQRIMSSDTQGIDCISPSASDPSSSTPTSTGEAPNFQVSTAIEARVGNLSGLDSRSRLSLPPMTPPEVALPVNPHNGAVDCSQWRSQPGDNPEDPRTQGARQEIGQAREWEQRNGAPATMVAEVKAEGEAPAGVDAEVAGAGRLMFWKRRRQIKFEEEEVTSTPSENVENEGVPLPLSSVADCDDGAGEVKTVVPLRRNLFRRKRAFSMQLESLGLGGEGIWEADGAE